jgi:ERF superfamily
MTDIQKRGEVRIEQLPEPTSLLEAVMREVRNPDTDPARLREFLEIGERLEARQAKALYNDAFADLKAALPVIDKRGTVLNKSGKVQFKYARYDDLHRAITPLLLRFGFSTSFDFEEPGAGRLTVILHLRHRGGHQEDFRWTLPAMGQNQFVSNLQNAAAARSFGKRCVLIDALDILTEDQDSDGRPQAPPESVTDEEVATIEDICAACEECEPGFTGRFRKWVKLEMKADKLGELFQGEQLDAVMDALAKGKTKLGVK